jgi:serine protease DegQ
MKWQTNILLASLLVALIPKSNVLSACNIIRRTSGQKELLLHFSESMSVDDLQRYAQTITVKVMSDNFLGSGIIIQKQGNIYTILTNAHVIRAGSAPYRVQTNDGRIHETELLQNHSFGTKDLAALQFRSRDSIYNVSLIGTPPMVKDRVFAAGFPNSENLTVNKDFVITSGRVSLILHKSLEGGYKIAYTNQIKQGMSGGPLLNNQGYVIGVNGMHAYPLWDAPSLFDDGSQVDDNLNQIIARFSWAVPIDTFWQFK